MSNLTITADRCNLGAGVKVTVEIDEMGLWSGTEVRIERRFTGGRESARYQAARYIRGVRGLWRDGELLDVIEGNQRGK